MLYINYACIKYMMLLLAACWRGAACGLALTGFGCVLVLCIHRRGELPYKLHTVGSPELASSTTPRQSSASARRAATLDSTGLST